MPSLTLAVPATIGHLGLGGAALKVLQSLHAQGWQVRAIDASGGPPIRSNFEISSIPLAPVMWSAARSPLRYRPDWLLNLGNVSFDLWSSRRLGRPDVFYGASMACLHTMTIARKVGALRVLHAAPPYLPRARAKLVKEYARLRVPGQPFNDRAVARAVAEYREADLIRAESKLTRESFVEGGIPEEKILLVPPSIDLEVFKPAERPPERFTVAFVGGFNILKGLHHLLAAWDLVARNEDQLVLHGGGDGWAKRLLAPYLTANNVSLSSGTPQRTLRSASVCVCPSLVDSFCAVVLEAMASGIPVIVSDQVGAKDLIRDGCEGYVVPAGDVGAIAERIRHLRDHPGERARMGSAARRRVESCTSDSEGQGLSGAFVSALEKRRQGQP